MIETSDDEEVQKETDIWEDRLQGAHLIDGNKGFINLWGVVRGLQGECISLVGAEVLGMPHLHEE